MSMLLAVRAAAPSARTAAPARRAWLSASATTAQEPLRRKDYTAPPYLMPRIELDFTLDAEKTLIKSRLHLTPNREAGAAAADDLILDGESLYCDLLSLRVGSTALSASDYTVEPERLVIPAASLPAAADLSSSAGGDGGTFVVEAEVAVNPKKNLSFAGLYVDGGGNFMTQCEAHGFRRITYGLDRPDVLSVYSVAVRGDKRVAPVLLSNGNLVSAGDDDAAAAAAASDGSWHFAEWHDPWPKPSYLFALVAGKLACVKDTYVTRPSGRRVDLAIYSEPAHVDQLDFAMDSLKRSMRWDEDKYGLEYDLGIYNIVATDSFNMGAMENKVGAASKASKQGRSKRERERERERERDALGSRSVFGFHPPP